MIKDALRASAIYGAATILSRGLSFFVLPIYTRVLQPADYGVLEMIITLGSLANLVVALEISQGLARFWNEQQNQAERRLLASTTWWFSILAYSLFFSISLYLIEPICRLLFASEAYKEPLAIGLAYISVNGIFYLLQNQFRWEFRSKEYAVVSAVYSVLTLGLGVWFAFVQKMALTGIVLGQLLAASGATLLAWWLLRKTFSLAFRAGMLKDMLLFSAPLVPAGLASFISFYVNRLALNTFSSLTAVGLFSISNRIASLITLLIVGIQAALTPLVYAHHDKPETPQQLSKLFDIFIAFSLSGCLWLSLFSRELLSIFATRAYLPSAGSIALLAPALLLSQLYIFSPGIALRKKTHWQLVIMLATATVSVSLNWLLVPTWGTTGAALATLLAAAVFFFSWLAVSQQLYPIPYRWRPLGMAVLLFTACVLFGLWLDTRSIPIFLLVMIKVLVLIVLMLGTIASNLIEKKDIAHIINSIKPYLTRKPAKRA